MTALATRLTRTKTRRRKNPRPPKLTRWQRIVIAAQTIAITGFTTLLLLGIPAIIGCLAGIASNVATIQSILYTANGRHTEGWRMTLVGNVLLIPMLAGLFLGV